jgi:hypothetical protein
MAKRRWPSSVVAARRTALARRARIVRCKRFDGLPAAHDADALRGEPAMPLPSARTTCAPFRHPAARATMP